MIIRLILNEAKNIGFLYHFTTIPSLINILLSNKLESPISLTRNKNFNKVTSIIPTEARITLDGSLLSNNYKISPFNYGYRKKWVSDKGKTEFKNIWDPEFEDQSEEVINKDIINLKKYIKEINVNEIDMWDYLDEDYIHHLDQLSYYLGKKTEDLSYDDIERFLLKNKVVIKR